MSCWRSKNKMDKEQIVKFFEHFPRGIYLKTIKSPMIHGVFTNRTALEAELEALAEDTTMYFIGHKFKEGIDVPINTFDNIPKKGGIKKKDITAMKYLVIDIDPVDNVDMSTGEKINLSAKENQRVVEEAKIVRNELLSNGFSNVGLINSGNGAYLVLPFKGLKNPNDKISVLKKFVQILKSRVKLEYSMIDESTVKTTQCFKVPGTLSTKGKATKGNPYRHAVIIEEWVEATSCIKSIENYIKRFEKASLVVQTSEGPRLDVEACIEYFQELFPVYYGGNQDYYARVETGGHYKDLNLDSPNFQRELRIHIRKETGLKIISPLAIDSIITYLKDKAYLCEESTMASRAFYDQIKNIVYYDLCNGRDVVEISSNAINIVDKPLGMFIQQRTDIEQKRYVPTAASELPKKLRQIAKLDDGNILVLATFLCACFLGNFFPTPILLITGAQGTSKSTLTRFIQQIVHPQVSGLLTLLDKKQDIAIALSTRLLTCFDNATGVKAEIADLLCSAVTKGCFQTRELYTTAEERLIIYKSIMVINGIDVISRRTDLMERCIMLEMESIKPEERKAEKEMDVVFENTLPSILGAIFDTIQKALAMDDMHLPSLSRMADFESWSVKFAIAMGFSAEEYQEALRNNQKNLVDAVSFGNPTILAVVELMRGQSVVTDSVQHFYGACTDVLNEKTTKSERSTFPKSPAALSRMLGGMEKNLKSFGITFNIKNIGPNKEITLWNDGTVLPTMAKKDKDSKLVYKN